MRSFWHKKFLSPRLAVVLGCSLVLLWWLFAAPFFQQALVSIDLEMEQYDHVQVFWAGGRFLGGGKDYSEKKSQVQRISAGRATLDFSIPSLKAIKFLRIDPSTRETSFILHSITITQPGFSPIAIDTTLGTQGMSLQNVVLSETTSAAGIILQSLGKDPQLVLPLDSDFSYLQYVQDKMTEYQHFIRSKMDLLGLDWSGFFFLGVDILLLMSISATILAVVKLTRGSPAELCVLLGLTGIAVVLASVFFCGVLSLLNWVNLLISHITFWVLLHLFAAKGLTQLLPLAAGNVTKTFGLIVRSLQKTLWPAEGNGANFLSAALLAAVIFLLFYSLIPAAFTLPLNFDSNDYRLSRVGYWLQEGNIWQFPTNDIRQIIMPSNCDLAMLWITSFFKKGYPLVHLISYFGGLLVCFSIYAISRCLKFSKHLSLIAVLIWLGIPNSAAQMLTSQTDLFTTGCLMTGLYCFYQAVWNRKYAYYLYAGLGIGIAVGAKSTVFLWGPGLVFLCLAIIVGSFGTLQWKVLVKGLVLLAVFMSLSGGFVYGQNFVRYGNFLGPSNVVSSISDSRDPVVKEAGVRKKMSKSAFVYLRAKAYLWQVFEPNSNHPAIRSVTNAGFTFVEEGIFQSNKNLQSSFVAMFKAATSWLREANRLSEDYASFGVVPFILLFLGGTLAVVRSLLVRDSQSIAVGAMFGAVVLYMLFFCWIVGWTVHRYRYAVLVTPLIAVTGMYLLQSISVFSNRFIKGIATTVVLLVVVYQMAMSIHVSGYSRAHGWFAFRFPEKVYSYIFYWHDARHLTDSLPDNVHRLGLVLAKGSWKSMFYRTGREIQSFIIPVEHTVDATYTFLNTNHFDALITKKLSSIRIEDHFNLIPSLINTYQALIPEAVEEKRIPWLIPNGSWSDGWVKLKGEVRVGNWKSDFLSLELCNPAPVNEKIIMKSSMKSMEIELEANSECEKINIPVNDNDFISWRVTPGYHPWKESGAKEIRSLGVVIKFPKPE